MKWEQFRLDSIWDHPAIFVIIITNAIPFLVIALGELTAIEMLVFYWLEMLIIGFFTILQMLFVKGLFHGFFFKLFIIGFFILHFGGFFFAEGMIITELIPEGSGDEIFKPMVEGANPFYGTEFAYLWWSFAFGHFVIYIMDFWIGGEWKEKENDVTKYMLQPYIRVLLIHTLGLIGIFIFDESTAALGVMILIMLVKTIIDVLGYRIIKTKYNKPVA